MNSITRRTFFGRISTLPAAAILLPTWDHESTPLAMWGGGNVENLAFRLFLSPKDGLKNTRIAHQPTGLALADGDYSYTFGRPEFRQASISHDADGLTAVSMRGTALEGRLVLLY